MAAPRLVERTWGIEQGDRSVRASSHGRKHRRQTISRLFVLDIVLGRKHERWKRPEFEPDFRPVDDDERAGRWLRPGPAVEVSDAVVIGGQRQVGVAAGDEAKASASRILDGSMLDELAVPLDFLAIRRIQRGPGGASISGCSRRLPQACLSASVVGDDVSN